MQVYNTRKSKNLKQNYTKTVDRNNISGNDKKTLILNNWAIFLAQHLVWNQWQFIQTELVETK